MYFAQNEVVQEEGRFLAKGRFSYERNLLSNYYVTKQLQNVIL